MLISFLTMKSKSLTTETKSSVVISKSMKVLGVGVLALVAVFAGLLLAPSVTEAQAAGFKDVPESHPYHVQIETLAQLGIINGYADGTFRPDNQLTRQQFTKMTILSMRLSVSEDDKCLFTDVKKSSDIELYPDNYIAAAVREGIVSGYPGLIFKPDAAVTMAQLVTMGTRAAERPLLCPGFLQVGLGNFDKTHSVIARVAQYNGLLRELAYREYSEVVLTLRPGHARAGGRPTL